MRQRGLEILPEPVLRKLGIGPRNGGNCQGRHMNDLMDSPFKAEQISVFLENRAGRLAKVIQILADADINIRGVSLADTSDFGILRLMVSDVGKAVRALEARGFAAGRTTVVAVEMADEPGSLSAILQMLSRDGINVEYMYALARRDAARAMMVFRFEKVDEAIEILGGNHVAMIPAAELCA